MRVRIDSLDEIRKELGINPGGKAQKYFTNTCYRYMDKYVPMSDLDSRGDLRTIVDIDDDSITYCVPYASYQYYGVREDKTHKVSHYTTPGTGAYWDQLMMDAERDDVVKEVANYMKRGA